MLIEAQQTERASATAEMGVRRSDIKLLIATSALGTVFEWYDFFVYGTLATIIATHFFPTDNLSASLLIS